MAAEQIVYDDVGPGLTREMLILRVGAPVDVDSWWAKLMPEARMRCRLYEFELGEKVKRHYLKIDWRPREMIGFVLDDRRLRDLDLGGPPTTHVVGTGDAGLTPARPVAVWWLDEGETISGALRSAAEMYWGALGAWPRIGLMWKEPPGPKLAVGEAGLAIRMAKWVPVGCVVVL